MTPFQNSPGTKLLTFTASRMLSLPATAAPEKPDIPIIFLAIFLLAAYPAVAQQLADGRPVPAGDPTLFYVEGNYYVFSSGPGAPIFRSPDLFTWKPLGRVFDKLPEWATQAVLKSNDYVWAPDILKIGDEYRAYWSTSTPGSRRSVIGFASNRTLDPASPDYRWLDRGKVIETFLTNDWNAIDPQCFVDQEGKVWLAMGSYWTGIKLHRLDRQTGHLSAGDPTLYSLARRTDVDPPALEGAYLIWHDGYYYLFVSFDRCHRGVDSDYNIRVGRSPRVTGPYADRSGKSLMDSGGTLIFESQGQVRGPGHNSVLQHNGKTWTAFHYFNDPQRKGSRVLEIRAVTWDKDGWPKVGDVIKAPETLREPAATGNRGSSDTPTRPGNS